ncbi:MAG TPA: LamG-like jellyroll fold domain-containing protein, partial [Polyangiaceae bacterium]|nr:LamG-like jellyroll fold domain-containing protein [Polyangiaceae bacterium]
SGVERLPQQFLGAAPDHFLVASDATLASWVARAGANFDVADQAALTLAEPAPFADPGSVLSHAGAVTFNSDSVWADTSTGALALEAVFRGQPGATLLSQRDARGGLEWSLDGSGRAVLRLDSGVSEVVATSPVLVADAWHHCLALFDAGQGVAQMFCNGQAGDTANVPSGFSVTPSQIPATLGSSAPARLSWAELASWRATSFGAYGAWTGLARERFARLVGTYAEGAKDPLPFAEMRASGAYIDMSPSDAPEQRRLHPVGQHWPRIVCRPTVDSPRTCGLLVETASSQQIAPAAFTLDNWTATELTLAAAAASGPTGAATLFALTPSVSSAAHSLELAVPFAAGPAVFAFFARAGSAHLIRAEVVGGPSATFDLSGPSVVDSTGGLVAAAEPWGNGLVRLSYSFNVNPGAGRLRLTLLNDASATAFAGDGSVAAQVGDAALSFRSFSTPLPTFGSIEQPDHLIYPASSGNLPQASNLSFSAEVWLPAAPLLVDAAILNLNFAAGTDQQINLFVPAKTGAARFVGTQGATVPWLVSSAQTLTDGKLHAVSASVGPTSASITVDGTTVTGKAAPFDTSVLDRIEIGISATSSGALTGLVRHVRIAPP